MSRKQDRRDSVELLRIPEIPGTAVYSLTDDPHGLKFHPLAQLLATECGAQPLGEVIADGEETYQRFRLTSGAVICLHYGRTTGTELFAEDRNEPALLALVERLQGMEWPTLKP